MLVFGYDNFKGIYIPLLVSAVDNIQKCLAHKSFQSIWSFHDAFKIYPAKSRFHIRPKLGVAVLIYVSI